MLQKENLLSQIEKNQELQQELIVALNEKNQLKNMY